MLDARDELNVTFGSGLLWRKASAVFQSSFNVVKMLRNDSYRNWDCAEHRVLFELRANVQVHHTTNLLKMFSKL